MGLHDVRFPGESEAYRNARDTLLAAELDLRRQAEAVSAARRALPPGGEVPTDYVFDEWDAAAGAPREVTLSELFAPGRDALFLYSFMFHSNPARPDGEPLAEPCPMCSSAIDGLDGEAPHIATQINFAVATRAPIERFAAHARARGWRNIRLLSSARNTYNRDYHAETPAGDQLPIATTFARENGTIRHVWSSELFFLPTDPGQHPRHVDFMWPLWAILDSTAAGRDPSWVPALSYG